MKGKLRVEMHILMPWQAILTIGGTDERHIFLLYKLYCAYRLKVTH